MREKKHPQVPFVTSQGIVTECDEGLFETLTLLKEMGVETQFSCQGAIHGGYICGPTPGLRMVVRKAFALYKERQLSLGSAEFLNDWFCEGDRDVKLPYHRGYRNKDTKRSPQYFSYERDTDSMFGDRTIIRWPKKRAAELHQLLLEIQPHI